MSDINSLKQAVTDYPVNELIARRWSPRAYDQRKVETEKLQRIFEAARWAASSSNLQPWYFLVGFSGDDVYAQIFNSLVEFNRLWVIHAPVLAVAISKTTNSRGDVNPSHAYDLGQAMALLSMQATEAGVYVHQMGGFNKDTVASAFNIPDEFKVQVAFTLGYLSDAEILHPNLQKLELSPRTRRPISESVFTGSFGHKADFL